MRRERGYTLIEALIAMVLLIVILGGTLNLLDTTGKIAPQENERAHAVREAEVELGGMVRELRQARRVYSINATSIEVRVPLVGGELRRVRYSCPPKVPAGPTRTCLREQYNAAGTAVERTTPAIQRVVDPDGAGPAGPTIFTPTTDGAGNVIFVGARIEVPASGERATGHKHTIVLDDGFFLRNVANG